MNISNPFIRTSDTAKETQSQDSIDFEENMFKELFENSPQISEQAKKERIKVLQQQGFQISGRNDIDTYQALEAEILLLRENALLTVKSWFEYYESFIEKVSQKRALTDERIKELRERDLKFDIDITEHKEKRKVLKAEVESLKKDLIAVREMLSKAKKGIGERLILDAETELNKVVQLQKTIYQEVKYINEDRFKNTKPALDELIRKWKEIRVTYVDRFQILNAKVKILGGDGINQTVAYTLIGLGSATAGVAGYFFAIFASKSDYSSNDVLYYLLKNIINATINPTIPVYIKFLCILAVLAIITAASWLVDFLIRKANKFKAEESKNEPAHQFAANFKVEGLSYDFKTREKSWLLVWLKAAPILLIVGTVILLLSHGQEIESDTSELSASTEGLLIGTAIAMGLSAAVYVYITKVTELRIETIGGGNHIRRNWELITAMLIFILSIVAFAFYKSEKLKYQGIAGSYSITGFIGSCLITAFAFSYGLRFLGLLLSMNEIETHIDRIDELIALNSIPYQPSLNLKINAYFTELSDGLLYNIRKKNESILDTDRSEKVTVSADDPVDSAKKRFFDFIIPKSKKRNLDEAGLFEIMEWEMEYFPEYAEQLKVLASLYSEKRIELTEVEMALKNCIDKKEEKKDTETAIQKLHSQKDRLNALVLKAQKSRIENEDNLKKELDSQISYIKDGFDLGLWYRQNGMGPRQYQLLLTQNN